MPHANMSAQDVKARFGEFLEACAELDVLVRCHACRRPVGDLGT